MRLLSVVVNYRTPELLNRFIETYIEYVDQEDRALIIVDVDPDESSARINLVDDIYDDRIFYMGIDHNCGYAKAVNMAVAASGEIGTFSVVCAFNSDCFFMDRECVDSCLDLFEREGDIGVVGPMQIDDSQKITHAGIIGSNKHQQMRGWLSFNHSAYSDVINCITVSGSAYFVRKSLWDELTNCKEYASFFEDKPLGAFLPTQHYYEETYLSLHARHHGWRVVYNGKGKMGHSWHKSSPLNSETDSSIMVQSRDLYRAACAHHGMECN